MEKRVGFALRLGAFSIDVVFVLILSFAAVPAMGALLGPGFVPQDASLAASLTMARGAVIGAVYFLIEGLTGASIGKMILKLKVGRPDGQPGSVGLFLLRWAIKNVGNLVAIVGAALALAALGPGLPIFLIGVGNVLGLIVILGCFLALRQSKQALHDVLARTAVYRRDDLAPATHAV